MSDASLEPAPFCSACGYDLSGAFESSKCPECGRPLVEVLVRDEGAQVSRRRYQSEQTFLGLPLVSVAFGRDANGKPGHAKGWLAIGDKATGVSPWVAERSVSLRSEGLRSVCWHAEDCRLVFSLRPEA